jgi:hypothetical protein
VGNYYEVAGTQVNKYYYAGGSRFAMNAGGTLYYLLSDKLDSTSITTNYHGVEIQGASHHSRGRSSGWRLWPLNWIRPAVRCDALALTAEGVGSRSIIFQFQ